MTNTTHNTTDRTSAIRIAAGRSVAAQTAAPPRIPTEELGGLRLTLRDDLQFTLQSYGGQTCYVVEDEARGQYFRIGLPEYTFLSLLDGRTTVGEALARSAAALGPQALGESESAAICQWLVDNQLATTSQILTGERLDEKQRMGTKGRWARSLNPLAFCVKLFNPEPLLDALLPLTRWMFRPLGGLVWLGVVLAGLFQVILHWDRLTRSSVEVVAPDNWLWMAATWLGLKLCHEASHGWACLTYGGRVREAGVNTVLFVPLPYVDVTSAWRIPSKWTRIFIAAAGMYAELFLATVAALVWSRSEIGVVQQTCVNVMLTGGCLTVLFNLNPLMRFDGYYMLADWLELPNLAHHGHQDSLQLGKRWLFGVKRPEPPWPRRAGWIVRLYGLLALGWKLTVTASLILAAEMLFRGAGIVLAALAVVLWIVFPVASFVRYFLVGRMGERPQRLRAAALMCVAGLAGTWGWYELPCFEQLVLPAVFDYTPAVPLRTAVAGFVRHVHVQPGEVVNRGRVLLEIENRELDFQRAELETAIARSEQMSLSHHTLDDIAAKQIEDENRRGLRQKLAENAAQRERLIVKAPVAGIVIGEDLASLVGQFVTPGETLFLLGDERTKQIQTLVSQENVDVLRERIGQEVEVSIWGRSNEALTGRLTKVEPSASTSLRHPALAATAGGPLPVRNRHPHDSHAPQADEQTWELLEPRFVANVTLDPEVTRQLGAGQLGTVRLTTVRRSVGEYLAARIVDWIEEHRPLQ